MEEPVAAVQASNEVEMKSSRFDLHIVTEEMSQCLQDDDLLLDAYLAAYKELNKFFHLLGKIFSFVASDVDSKIKILEKFRSGENGSYYSTIKGMVDYETKASMLQKKDYNNGSRTLLRLHRALEFIENFLEKVQQLENKDKTSSCAQEIYTATLAKYHPYLIQKAAILAMYALPTREGLLEKVCGNDPVVQKAMLDALPKAVQLTREVYAKTQEMYKEKNLLDLP